MPKLSKKAAREVSKAEVASGGFLLDEGRYAARLKEVEEKPGNVAPYWQWVLTDIHDEEGNKKPGNLWHITSLSDKSVGFLKGVFEAFGYTADSDTDEMLGEWVVVYVVQEPITKGPRAGQLRNRIQSLHEFDEDDWDIDMDSLGDLDGGKTAAADDDDDDEY